MMKDRRFASVIVLSCLVMFLFTDAKRISPRKLRKGNATWYLEQILDSAAFFSADTLRFVNPHPGNFQVTSYTNGIPDKDDGMDTLHLHPQLIFGTFQKNQFGIHLDWKVDTIHLTGCIDRAWGCGKTLYGKFYLEKKTKIITLDFYDMDMAHPSDYIDTWIKYDTKKYRVVELTKRNLVLVKADEK